MAIEREDIARYSPLSKLQILHRYGKIAAIKTEVTPSTVSYPIEITSLIISNYYYALSLTIIHHRNHQIEVTRLIAMACHNNFDIPINVGLIILWFLYGFIWFSYGFPMIFPGFPYSLPTVFLWFCQVQFFQQGLQVALLPSEREGRPWSGRDVNLDVDFVALAGRGVGMDAWRMDVLPWENHRNTC